jgi:protein SCO1/2
MKSDSNRPRGKWFAILVLVFAGGVNAQTHPARGIVIAVAPKEESVTISCEAIPGYMDAMEMRFKVSDASVLAGFKPGTAVSFMMVEHQGPKGEEMYAENLQVRTGANLESEPLQAGQLTALHKALSPANELAVGDPVPDFVLTDQTGQRIRLSQFQGMAVALTFGYSRCPNPSYCFRLSNNLARVEKRFHNRAGHDFVLLTIAIDPEHDQGATLAKYAETWRADPASWHFLTGPLPEIRNVAGMFGMNFWGEEGLVTHSLRTAIIDRKGQLAANLEGNAFTAEQLGDLLEKVMDRR